ncbi:MAG: hypothetical protein ACRCWD_05440 [Culicoidibacterales bacterium]
MKAIYTVTITASTVAELEAKVAQTIQESDDVCLLSQPSHEINSKETSVQTVLTFGELDDHDPFHEHN